MSQRLLASDVSPEKVVRPCGICGTAHWYSAGCGYAQILVSGRSGKYSRHIRICRECSPDATTMESAVGQAVEGIVMLLRGRRKQNEVAEGN